ncbi:MAG: hypothetical protein ABGZ08_05190 [Akkermansiaceae bacterium]|jgi:hypothetical protein
MALNKKTTIIAALGALILPVAAKHHEVEAPAETKSCCDGLSGLYGVGYSSGNFSAADGSEGDADGYTLGLRLNITEDTEIFFLYQDYDNGDFNEATAVLRKSYDLLDGFTTKAGIGYGTQSIGGSVASNAIVGELAIGTEIAGIGVSLTYDHNFVLDSDVNDDFATMHLVGVYPLSDSMNLWAAYEWQVSGDTLVEKDDTTSIGIGIRF